MLTGGKSKTNRIHQQLVLQKNTFLCLFLVIGCFLYNTEMFVNRVYKKNVVYNTLP